MMTLRVLAVSTALTLGGGVVPARASGHMDQAAAHVYVEVIPYVVVSDPVVVVVNLQDSPAGWPIASRVRFSVRSNAQEVELYVACTDLYKSGNPASPYRIPVTDPGAEIMCEEGATGDPDRVLAWSPHASANALPAGWTGAVSESGVFTAPANVFSQDVTVDVSWRTTDRHLPMGEYQGIVRLVGMVRP